MEVILLEKVNRLGNLGEKVKVKAGFGRNFLIPFGKAVPATKEHLAQFEQRRAELEKKAADGLVAAQKRAKELENLVVTISARAADEGKLYGSLSVKEIADAVTKAGVNVEKREVHLPEGALRNIGDYEVEIQLHTDVLATVKIKVVEEK